MKTKKNQGVSLMVLILTVIVMTILAGTVIISLNNAGIINRSKGTVEQYNLSQVEELANLGWGEAYLAENTTQQSLETYVMDYLTRNGVDVSKYNIVVTTKGVTVSEAVPGVQTAQKITNPYDANGWEKAWTYTNGVWSQEIQAGNTATGDIIAKLYKTGNKVSVTAEGSTYNEDAAEDNGNEIRDEYVLVIEGSGVLQLNTTEESFKSTCVCAWGGFFPSASYLDYVCEVIICDGITEIAGEVFKFPDGYEKDVIVGNGSYDNYYFTYTHETYYDSYIIEVTLPSTIQKIDTDAFYGIDGLKTLNYGGTEDDWKNVTINTGNDSLLSSNINYAYTKKQEVKNAITNPYNANGWKYAWTCTNGYWKDTTYTSGQTISGAVTAKLYEISAEENVLVIEGNGWFGSPTWYRPDILESGVAYLEGYEQYTGEDVPTYMNNISQIIICDGIINIPYSAFSLFEYDSIVIPQTVKYISSYACNSNIQNSVKYAGTEEQWNKMFIQDSSMNNATKTYNYKQ